MMEMLGGMIGGDLMDAGVQAMQTMVNVREAHKQREWLEAMRKSQYQTAVKDMEKAGLNPILATRFGGSGVPAGSAARAAGGSLGGAARGQAITSAKLAEKQSGLLDAQTETTTATGRRQNAAASLDEAHAAKANMENIFYSNALKAAQAAEKGVPGMVDDLMNYLKGLAGGTRGHPPTNREPVRNFEEGNWEFVPRRR